MHTAGFDGVAVGIESGSDRQLRRYKKPSKSRNLANGIRRAKNAQYVKCTRPSYVEPLGRLGKITRKRVVLFRMCDLIFVQLENSTYLFKVQSGKICWDSLLRKIWRPRDLKISITFRASLISKKSMNELVSFKRLSPSHGEIGSEFLNSLIWLSTIPQFAFFSEGYWGARGFCGSYFGVRQRDD